MSYAALNDHPEWTAIVLKWIRDTWPERTANQRIEDLEKRLCGDRLSGALPQAWVWTEEGKPVGLVSLTEHIQDGERGDWIDVLFVAEIWRNRGIASRLLALAVGEAAKLGISRLQVYTDQVTLYERAGWRLMEPIREPGPVVMARAVLLP